MWQSNLDQFLFWSLEQILLVGGVIPAVHYVLKSYLFDPSDGTYSDAGNLPLRMSDVDCGAKPGSPELVVCAGGINPTLQKELRVKKAGGSQPLVAERVHNLVGRVGYASFVLKNPLLPPCLFPEVAKRWGFFCILYVETLHNTVDT